MVGIGLMGTRSSGLMIYLDVPIILSILFSVTTKLVLWFRTRIMTSNAKRNLHRLSLSELIIRHNIVTERKLIVYIRVSICKWKQKCSESTKSNVMRIRKITDVDINEWATLDQFWSAVTLIPHWLFQSKRENKRDLNICRSRSQMSLIMYEYWFTNWYTFILT